MASDCSSIAGADGALSKSGKTIYDSLHENPEFFLPAFDLETILREGLLGLDLSYPLRTRSKVLKSKICEILGYPVPGSFKRSKPRFPEQDFDTYIQKSNNLQIWNEQIVPTQKAMETASSAASCGHTKEVPSGLNAERQWRRRRMVRRLASAATSPG